MNMMQPSKHNTQSGSAFFLILIGIFLFAALSYALMQSSRTSMSTLSSEQARVAAQEIIAYADTVARAVHTLRLRGCGDTQIGFQTSMVTWFPNNPNSPSDKSCEVFDMNGGKVLDRKNDPLWLVSGSTNDWFWFNGQSAVEDIGTPQPELIMWIGELKPEVCNQINRIINGVDATDDNIGAANAAFAGTYSLVANGIGDDAPYAFKGKSSGCAGADDGGGYGFYQVLIAR